jgi:ergothioneine biosynthesis protein EgtB
MDQTALAGPALAGAASDTSGDSPSSAGSLLDRYNTTRAHTDRLSAALTNEDQCVQSMPDASPVKWHRAHTTWFFEEFVLRPHLPGYAAFDPAFRYLFNSYYETVGARHPRPSRGLITRPGAGEVSAYRAHVDQAMTRLLRNAPPGDVADLLELGFSHEQQHQELIVTDMLHAFAQNPLAPALMPGWQEPQGAAGPTSMIAFPGGVVAIGYDGPGFAFDNETPRHEVLLRPYRLADRLVRNAEWLGFMQDGGYRTPTLWMSDGWATVQEQRWEAPLYWRLRDEQWWQMGPGGLAPVQPDAPVRHVSWYEADAFARWAGGRLSTEAEWEAAAGDPRLHEQTGHVWQWTGSPYSPYPGYAPASGAIGEYNGKFMINQMALRGGSLATPRGHTRPSYRNFFYPDRRWQFSGLRLASCG